jgi:hypothetical protein
MYAFPIKNMKLKILKLLFFPCLGIVLFIFLDKFNILNLLYTKTQIIYEMNELFRGEKMFNYDDMIGMSISFTGMIFLLFFTFFLFFIKDLYLLIGLYISILFSICLIFYGLW